MDAVLMSSSLMPTDDELRLHTEIESLKESLAAETERTMQLAAEVGRLHGALCRASATLNENSSMCSRVYQIQKDRDVFKKRLEDHLKFKHVPLEAQLAEANRVLFEQRIQFRSIVDVLASQRDWVREWAAQCQENLRLQDLLSKREAGVEVVDLRKQLLEMQSKLAELTVSFHQREVAAAVFESNARTLMLEKERVVTEFELLKEQNRRLWARISSTGGVEQASPAVQD
jgi:hypothetical protein